MVLRVGGDVGAGQMGVKCEESVGGKEFRGVCKTDNNNKASQHGVGKYTLIISAIPQVSSLLWLRSRLESE
jgi:hypothetical protein